MPSETPPKRRLPSAPSEQKPEVAPGVFAGADVRRWRFVVLGVLAVALILGALWIWRGVKEGQDKDRWERLADITSRHDEGASDIGMSGSAVDALARDDYIRRLEDFIAREDAAAPATLHAHALVATLQSTQLLSNGVATTPDDRERRYASAAAHWKAVKDSDVELPLTANRFRPAEAARAVDLLLQRLEANRAWDAKHGMRPTSPAEDPTVLLRTSEGDLRLRLYAGADQSPKLVESFLAHVCKGDYDGTLLFERRDDSDEGWVHGGDLRVRRTDAPATDEARLTWVDAPTPDEPILPDAGRHRILHGKGAVSAWHKASDPYDDPAQFLLVTKASDAMTGEYTPFAQVEAGSFAVLDRIAAARRRIEEDPAIRMNAKLGRTGEQLVRPIVIVKALVYDKGVLRACHDATKVDETEKRLDTVKADALREIPPPPPAPPPPPPPAAPPSTPKDAPPPAPPATPSDPAK